MSGSSSPLSETSGHDAFPGDPGKASCIRRASKHENGPESQSMPYASMSELSSALSELTDAVDDTDGQLHPESPRQDEDNSYEGTDNVPPRDPVPLVPSQGKLEWWDVAALVVNKMVGTGIMTGPPFVLISTHSRSLAIGLWLLGFAYTVIR